MEKIEKISIGHYVFSLDADANRTVKEYLRILENQYLGQSDGAEIMDSIESRMAELLYERCGSDRVATENDIRKIIEILGYPETDTAEQPATADDNKQEYTKNEKSATARKRLYRDTFNRKIAGVCSGISQWAGIDPIWLRLTFCVPSILLIFIDYEAWWFILPFVLYLVLWLCIPKGVTARQRWEMRGESGSVDDIKRYRYEREHERIDSTYKKSGRGCLAVGFGIIILLVGLWGLYLKLMVFGGIFFGSNFLFGTLDWLSFSNMFTSFLNSFPITRMFVNPWIQMLWMLIFIIPSLLLIYGGIILIFDITTPKWRPGLCALGLWILLIIIIIPANFLKFRSTRPTITEEFKEWSEEWPDIQEWAIEHNLDNGTFRNVEEWLEEHNFIDEDSEFNSTDSLGLQNDDTIFNIKYNVKINSNGIKIEKTKTQKGSSEEVWAQPPTIDINSSSEQPDEGDERQLQ